MSYCPIKNSPDRSGYAVLQRGLLRVGNGIWTDSRLPISTSQLVSLLRNVY